MKNKLLLITTLCIAVTGLSLCGCASETKPPTLAERLLYDVHTNYVDMTVIHTNVITVTNATGAVTMQTNVTQDIEPVATYGLTTKTSTTGAIQAGGAVINAFLPGVGSMVVMGLLALLTGWSHLRGLRSQATSATLAQEIEALREFIQSLPSGAKYDAAIVSWLQQHQLEAGVATQVLDLLQGSVNNPEAKAAVTEIKGAIDILSKP